ERVIDWTRQWKQQGLEEGRQEGRQEGRLEGAQALLQKQLAARFGPLPDPVRDRLAAADSALLEAWSIRLLSAASLRDVFDA
ncbi:DUF4351 domain-containing protein, partial [Pigmentiphaga soli]|uniref:DUF4351 domain-containing protein n=1 Tax=Pigmentiphaga soli TaxID=1007095 RepID=UPI0031E81C87